MAATVIPTLTAPQIVQRISDLFPPNWAGDNARQSGNVYAFLLAMAQEIGAVLESVDYDLAATRLQTATSPELDLASVDFLGDLLPRPSGLTDAAFAALIIANLFRPAATRPALFSALLQLTGQAPRMLEPWNVLDTGWWRGRSYWNVDTVDNPARWGNGSLRYQGFIETAPPQIPAIGPNNPILTWGTAYWNVPGYFFGIINSTPQGSVYDVVNRLKAEGTLAWVKLTAPKPPPASTSPFSGDFSDAFGLGGPTTPVAPSPVTNLAVVTTSTDATVSWGPPAVGYPVNYAYTVFYRATGTSDWQVGPTISSSPAKVLGLQSNVSYDFEVIVRNSAGQAPSGIVTATVLKVPPGPATNLTVTNLGATALTLSWTMPQTGTPPFRCVAQYRVSGTTTWTPFGTAGNYSTIAITGLSPATSYDLEVVTSNA